MQEYQLAIFNLDTAIALRPDYAKAFANRAFAKEQLKKYKEAIEDYNKALEIFPNFSLSYDFYLLIDKA
jgi:tetratricopeptide (TPR) repeat protein